MFIPSVLEQIYLFLTFGSFRVKLSSPLPRGIYPLGFGADGGCLNSIEHFPLSLCCSAFPVFLTLIRRDLLSFLRRGVFPSSCVLLFLSSVPAPAPP